MSQDSERGKYSSPEGSKTWEYFIAGTCASGVFLLGLSVGWSAPSLVELIAPNSTIPLTVNEATSVTAAMPLGSIISPFLSVFIVDRFGRKKTMLGFSIPLVLSWLLIILAKDAIVLIMARLSVGFAMGMITCLFPIYQGEIMSTELRGSVGAVGFVLLYIGLLFIYVVAPRVGVRIMAAICFAFSLVFTTATFFLPESPYWLTMVGRLGQAEATLGKIRGKTDVSDELELIKLTIKEKGKSILSQNEEEASKQNVFKKLFTIRGNLKAFGLSVVLVWMQHVCGIGAVLVYGPIIFKAIGSDISPMAATVIFGVLQIMTSIIAIFVVDRFGRRPLLITSGIVSSIFLAIIDVYFYFDEHTDVNVKPFAIIPLCSMFAFVMALNFGVLLVPGILCSEIFATDVKALANSINTVYTGFVSAAAAKAYLVVAITWGYGHTAPFFLFATSNLLCSLVFIKWLPETKGKTLLQIQRELNA